MVSPDSGLLNSGFASIWTPCQFNYFKFPRTEELLAKAEIERWSEPKAVITALPR